ncbi:inovirus Gp2 family protein [Burkholderia paludis]|uniref:inovirus Gp2 family protein n=1 Tax=Burkholderia paludis TaxID=1506587 RepID=UPI001F2A9FB4|nr:inovirus Gp2 family protein [Burkholderia paludis]
MNKPNLSNNIDPQILDGLAQHIKRSMSFRVTPGGGAEICDGPGIGLLVSLDRFVWTALATELSPFHVQGETYLKKVCEWDANGQQHEVLLPTTVVATRPNPSFSGSNHLATLLFSIKDSLATHPTEKHLLYPPHLRLLRDLFLEHPISRSLLRTPKALVDDTGLSVAKNCNDFVDRFRQAMRDSKLLRRERFNWNLGSLENLTRLHAYLDGLFAPPRSSLTVLHLRLLCDPAVEGDHRSDLQVLRDCRAKLFDRMRRNLALFSSKPGFVWAILPSADGQFHLHLTLLFDTATVRKLLDDKRVEADLDGMALKDHADLIGTYWVEGVTEGRGSYYRADGTGNLYDQDWIHGEVRADDTERRDRLKRALGYLAMRRALVRLSNEPAGEYFGMRERKARSPRRPPRGEAKAG